MSLLRKSLRVSAALVALVVLVTVAAAAFVGWLGWTGAGLTWTVARLESLQAVHISVAGARGRLAGPLHLDGFELRTERVTVRTGAVDLEHRPLALLAGRVAITRLAAGQVTVEVRPSARASSGPPSFMPRWLSVSLRQAQVGSVDVGLPGGTRLHYTGVSLAGTITRRHIRLRQASLDAGSWSARGHAELVSHEPLRLDGEVDWRVAGEPALSGTLRAKGDLAQLDLALRLTQPTAASAEVRLVGLQEKPGWQAQLAAEAFHLAPWLKSPPVGPLSGHLEGRGTFDAFALHGHLDAAGLAPGGVDLEARLTRTAARLSLDSLVLTAKDPALRVAATGWLDLGARHALHLQSDWDGLRWPLAGAPAFESPRGRLALDGWSQFAFTTTAVVALRGVPATQVTAAGRLDRDGVSVSRSTLDGRLGHADGSGYLGFGPARPWQVTAAVADLDLDPLVPGLASRLSFRVAGSGAGVGPGAAWAAHVEGIAGRLRGYAASGAGTVLHHPGHYAFQAFKVAVGPAHLAIEGSVGESTALTAALHAPDLAGLMPGAGGSLEAQASLHSAGRPLAGRPNLRLDLSLRGHGLRYGEQRAGVLSADADVDLSDREKSWVRLRVADVVVGGQTLDSARLALDGYAREHGMDLRIGTGKRAIDVLGTGRYQDARYSLVADRLTTATPGLYPYALEGPLRFEAAAGRASLERSCFVDARSRLCVAGAWNRRDGWNAALDVADFPLEALGVDLPGRPAYRGRFDLGLRAAGRPGQPWTASADGTLRDARLGYTTPSGRREEVNLGVTELKLQSLPDHHELTVSTTDSDALQLHAEATVERRPGLALGQSPVHGSLRLATTRLGLLPLVLPDIDRAAGRLDAALTVSGSAAAPVAAGTLILEGGEIDLYQTNLRLRDVAARVGLEDTRLTLEASGKAGDGSFRTDGTFSWTDRKPHGRLHLSGDRLLVANVPEARVEASPDLTFAVDGRDIAVSGSVTIPDARIEPRQIVGAVTVSPDEVLVGQESAQQAASAYRVRTDVRLVLGKHVTIDAFGLTGRLTGSVLARTRPGEVATASGELEVEEGKYRAYGKDLDIERGKLLFAGGPVTDPGVDLRASKKVPGYTVGVSARGRLRKPELSLYSDPSLPQSQIASLLLVGRRLDNLDVGDRATLGGSSGSLAAEGGAILAGQLGRYVGLDQVSYETDAAANSALVIGKFLSPRLYVSYGISLTNAINTFKLQYTIGDRWSISGEAGQQASVDVEYTVDR